MVANGITNPQWQNAAFCKKGVSVQFIEQNRKKKSRITIKSLQDDQEPNLFEAGLKHIYYRVTYPPAHKGQQHSLYDWKSNKIYFSSALRSSPHACLENLAQQEHSEVNPHPTAYIERRCKLNLIISAASVSYPIQGN